MPRLSEFNGAPEFSKEIPPKGSSLPKGMKGGKKSNSGKVKNNASE